MTHRDAKSPATCWVIVKDIGEYDREPVVVPIAVFLTEQEARDQKYAYGGDDVIEAPFGQSLPLAIPEGVDRYKVTRLVDVKDREHIAMQAKKVDPPTTWRELYEAEHKRFSYRGMHNLTAEAASALGLDGAERVTMARGHVFATSEAEAVDLCR